MQRDFSNGIFEPAVPITQAEFEAAYDPLPAGAVFLSYSTSFDPIEFDLLGGDRTYTIGGDGAAADSVFIENGAVIGQSAFVSDALGETFAEFGDPTPGSVDRILPPPPVVTTSSTAAAKAIPLKVAVVTTTSLAATAMISSMEVSAMTC